MCQVRAAADWIGPHELAQRFRFIKGDEKGDNVAVGLIVRKKTDTQAAAVVR